mgnify:CR=1 FL=1
MSRIAKTPLTVPKNVKVVFTATSVNVEGPKGKLSMALPSGVVLITNPDEVVISVYEPKEEVVEVAPVDLSAIEVAKKGKEVKEGEEGAAPAEAGAGEKDAKKATKKEAKKEPKKEEKK